MAIKIENNDNIKEQVSFIIKNIPEDVPNIEKVRYVYIQLGKIFCYDYRVMTNEYDLTTFNIDTTKVINMYQTCYQISDVLMQVINKIDGCEATIVERFLDPRYNQQHVSTGVIVDGKRYLLDLTLDLYNIQSGMRTTNFASKQHVTSEYPDFIKPFKKFSLSDSDDELDCETMDKHLGFITDGYTDEKIIDLANEFLEKDFSGLTDYERIDYKIKEIKEKLFKIQFDGNNEASLYIDNVLKHFISRGENIPTKKINLFKINEDDSLEVMNIYVIYIGEQAMYYRFFAKLGFDRISEDIIYKLAEDGWQTNSNALDRFCTGKDKDDDLDKKLKRSY